MKENDILQAQDVRFRYDTEQPNFAVDGVSMEVHRGEFVAVLGANGCGKSTLAKHFNAILLPESGTVLVEDMDTRTDEKLYDIRQKVGMVFQNPDNQIVATVVEEDVAFALENLGVPTGEMRTRVDDAMKLAGIYEQRNKAPHKLSGGQKQRVAIAGVIAMRPDCLILDESTAMLDPRGRAQVMKTIRNLRDAGISSWSFCVSPGNPVISVVRSAISGIFSRSLFITSLSSCFVVLLPIFFKMLSLACCIGISR